LSSAPPWLVGSKINVWGVVPTAYNGKGLTVTACTSTSVSYASTATGAQTTGGNIFNQNSSPLGTCFSNGHAWNVNGIEQVSNASTVEPYNPVTTGASGTGSTATLTFAASENGIPQPVGTEVVVAGVSPAGYNGTFTITASTATSISYASTATGAQTVAGTIFQEAWQQNDGLFYTAIWAPGMTWRIPGSYAGDDTNPTANNLWLGMYSESGMAPSIGGVRNLFFGGSVGNVSYPATHVDSSFASLTCSTGFSAPNNYGQGNPVGTYFGTKGSVIYDFEYYNGGNKYVFALVATVDGTLLQLTSSAAWSNPAEEWGLIADTSAMGPGHHFINQLFIGWNTFGVQGIQIGSFPATYGDPTTMPVNENQTTVAGSRFFDPVIHPGWPEGFQCVTSGTIAGIVGTPATYKPFGRQLGAITFSNRPHPFFNNPPMVGQISCFSDSTVNTFGSIVAGSGTHLVLAWYDGTNWSVIGVVGT
jgi:hypothetical protein